jgi:release factor glutamine methyltransferase
MNADAAGTASGTPAREALAAATDGLGAAGVESPRLDAELLLAEAAGVDRAKLAADPDLRIEPGAGRLFGAMVRRRLRREPVAYILGRKGFRRIELVVDRRVLIPRPETELLVDVALELKPATVLDVGTGSGAVALAIADELPGARVDATDTSAAALEVARANIGSLGLGDRVRCGEGSLPRGDGADGPAAYDLVVANLPYVSEADWEGLQPEIREHEPREALVCGPTGLEAISELIAGLGELAGCGAVALEVGEGQAAEVAELVRAAGFEPVEVRPDLAGIDRVVVGRR